MNNTRILAIVAVLTAATLVVGLTVAATMTPSAFAGGGKKDGQEKYMGGGVQGNGGKDNGSGNGNTKTIQVLKQNAKSSAFTDGYKKDGHDKYVKGKPANDSSVVVQNGQNSICTHPSETCTSQSNQPLEVP
jgi:poly(3-hydroxybutyrate) depolymerase